MQDHPASADSPQPSRSESEYPTIRLRQQKRQPWHARITQDQRTGDTIVTVRKGLLDDEALRVMREVLLILGRNHHPGLPEPVRRRLAAETTREEAERVAQMSPVERELHEAQQQIFREMMGRVDALEATA